LTYDTVGVDSLNMQRGHPGADGVFTRPDLRFAKHVPDQHRGTPGPTKEN
jgi:hypothetical protein